MMLTRPDPIFSEPISFTFAAFTIASDASIAATRPRVSTMPKASISIVRISFFIVVACAAGFAATAAGFFAGVFFVCAGAAGFLVSSAMLRLIPFLLHINRYTGIW